MKGRFSAASERQLLDLTIGVRTVTLLKNKAGYRDGNDKKYSYFIKGKIGL